MVAPAQLHLRVEVVVPLQQPRHQLIDAGQQRQQAVGRPALVVLHGHEVRRQGPRLLQVVVAGPGHDQRGVAVALGVRVADPAFLRHVQLAAQPPAVGLKEVRRGVLRRHGDGMVELLAGVLAALQVPGLLPLGPLEQARRLVAQHRQVRHRLGGHQFLDERRHVEDGIVGVEGADLHEVGVGLGEGGELGAGLEQRFAAVVGARPVAIRLQPIEQPAAQGPLLHVLPRLAVPAPLVLGLLDQGDVRVRRDDGESLLDEGAIVGGPVGGRFGDRPGAVPLEPGGPHLAGGDLAGQDDLEGPFPQRDPVV